MKTTTPPRALSAPYRSPATQVSPLSSLAPGWSGERALWIELARAGQNLPWKHEPLDSTRSHLIPPGDIGVYLICSPPPEQVLDTLPVCTVLYAGQVYSERRGFRTRFLEHIQRPAPKLRVYLRCYFPGVEFWYASVRDHARRNSLETLLIETLNPPCNSIQAPGSTKLLARIGRPAPIGRSRPRRSS